MIVGTVVGSVVCTQKDRSLEGVKMLIVLPIDIETLKPGGQTFVALDSVGAGTGELVLVVGGSSARMTDGFSKTCVDQSIIGIVDTIEVHGSMRYRQGYEFSRCKGRSCTGEK